MKNSIEMRERRKTLTGRCQEFSAANLANSLFQFDQDQKKYFCVFSFFCAVWRRVMARRERYAWRPIF